MNDLLVFLVTVIVGISTARIMSQAYETTEARNERRRVQRAIYTKYGRTY
jgi:hypothetical protein